MPNTLAAVTPQLLAQGLMALREMAVMPQLVNRQYDSMAGERGSTIDVPIPSSIAAQVVAPASVPQSTGDVSPTSVPIALDQWYEAPFYLTDRELLEVMEGTIPMQASEAIKALANQVDNYILAMYQQVPNVYRAGALSFSDGVTGGGTALGGGFDGDTSDATRLRRDLNRQLAPLGDRRVAMSPSVEAEALNLRAFQDASYSGSVAAIMEGQLNRKMGFDWWMDQNVPVHTTGFITGAPAVGAGAAAGDTTVNIVTVLAEAFEVTAGDVIQFSNHATQYVVQADAAIGASSNVNISILPALTDALTTSETVDIDVNNAVADTPGQYEVNLAFHRDAFAFATRPLTQATEGLGSVTQSAVDPISGLALRLEVTREHKRTRYSYDILYGAAVIRPELAVRYHTTAV